MANGQVVTGFSKPYVAKYTNTSGTVSYATPTALARGVDVSTSISTSSNNIFYADNQAAETTGGALFTEGTVTLTVDDLKDDAEKLIQGLAAADSSGWLAYDDTQTSAYFALAFVVRVVEDGVTSYVPFIFPKVSFDPINTSAKTQESDIDFQTQSISAKILKSDASNHPWKWVGSAVSTESAAVTAITTKLG